MSKKSISVTEAELAVLDILWEDGPSTIRQITDKVYEKGTTSEYATVQKLLERLQAKDCVKKSKVSHAHSFSATVSRSELIGDSLESIAQKLCSGSMTPILVHLTEKVKLSKADREMLRALIDES